MTPPQAAPRDPSFLHDVITVAGRGLRSIPRDPEVVVPSLVVPAFFFFVNIGAFEQLVEAGLGGLDFRAFQIPSAVLFGVTGVSRANAVVTDIQTGYLDRLLMTPVNRLALLVGLMVADFVMVMALAVPVLLIGLLVGAEYATGLPGVLVFIVITGLWGLVFAGFPYAIALRTGNPAAVNTSFIIFLPFMFLTTAFAPKEALSGWLSTAADLNPVTYLLAGLRSLLMEGWQPAELAGALAAVAALGLVSLPLAFLALRARVARR